MSNIAADPAATEVAIVPAPPDAASPLLSLGLGLVAVIAIWLIYQTWQQHITLAEGELRNQRARDMEHQ